MEQFGVLARVMIWRSPVQIRPAPQRVWWRWSHAGLITRRRRSSRTLATRASRRPSSWAGGPAATQGPGRSGVVQRQDAGLLIPSWRFDSSHRSPDNPKAARHVGHPPRLPPRDAPDRRVLARVAQQVRAPARQAGRCRFKSGHRRHARVAQQVEHHLDTVEAAGSRPAASTHALIAQGTERQLAKLEAPGSIPGGGTTPHIDRMRRTRRAQWESGGPSNR